ncbi:MAG: glutamate-5-semialdehyde dehydrogenase [Bacteroides sp.]|nr:glutamate-5-semialdehyde dehydrogenase [Roseburia sp.]MCM1345728.1 glutamate-5-semialdehyde dehydrogenase [Bacteroides sp.]MCM1419829.1 glutamate-5-semialdehyde dehydrogenase [Bacteroides sp.]
MLTHTFEQVKAASIKLALLETEKINRILCEIADAAVNHTEYLLEENKKDLDMMDKDNPMYDRLKLTEERIKCIASDTRKVAALPSPLGHIQKHIVLPNGLDLKRVSVPFGVIGVVYEARPNVTFDVFALCLKSGNACILKGGRDADHSNRAITNIIKNVLQKHETDEHIIELLPATHEATAELLHANGFVDLVIPRGSKRLIDFVRHESSVPVIETGAGVCHAYFDKNGDTAKGAAIIHNAKTRRVSVCNALDCMIIHADRLADLPRICRPLADSYVLIHADLPALASLTGCYPDNLLKESTEESYGTEFQSYTMAIKTVGSADEAIAHIRKFGSGHSECIISEDEETTNRFLYQVDAACVYSNAPTSFTDGAQFGLGAEIGISTQKLHARGPMALEEITTYKWIIHGNGQTREK